MTLGNCRIELFEYFMGEIAFIEGGESDQLALE